MGIQHGNRVANILRRPKVKIYANPLEVTLNKISNGKPQSKIAYTDLGLKNPPLSTKTCDQNK